MTEILETLESLGLFIIGVAALGFFARSIVTHFLSRDIELYKQKLRAVHDFEIENFKSRLRSTTLEHQVRFTSLHERRGEVIAELHNMLCDAEDALSGFEFFVEVAGEGDSESAKKIYLLTDSIRRNSIYFSQDLATKMRNLASEFLDPIAEFEYLDVPDGSDSMSRKKERFMESADRARRSTRIVRLQVEDEFRRLLGVPTSETEGNDEG